MDQTWKSINGFIVSFTYSFDQLKIQNSTRKLKKKKKKRKSSLKSVNHHQEKEYILPLREALTISSNWFWGSGFESPWSKFFVTGMDFCRSLTFFSFFLNLFFNLFFTCVVHFTSNIMW